MIKDEEGFLSEWVAYYQMHGFDHIMIFDDGSRDDGIKELEPWIKSGFVSVHSNWTVEALNIDPAHTRNEFKKAMTIKAALESQCKLAALKWGYNYTISLDLDEYVIPNNPKLTIVDELDYWFTTTGRAAYCASKLNFPSTPHILEPVNLLTIEAYQSRMRSPSKMNYYTSVAPKCAYWLNGPHFTNYTSNYIVLCCHFHGCQGHDFIRGSYCRTHNNDENSFVNGKGKKWLDGFSINHYSRSLEKYDLKGRTWSTSTGEVKPGQTSQDAAKSYDIPKFLHRSVGWFLDPTALRYACQLRKHLTNMTGEVQYLRPGLNWYRNPEFGKVISDPEKRGRYGRPNADGFKFDDKNPYHYHGNGYVGEKQ